MIGIICLSHVVKFQYHFFPQKVKDATQGVQWAAVPGAECLLLSNAGIFLRTAKSLTNSYGVAIIEDVHPGYYQVNDKLTVIFYLFILAFIYFWRCWKRKRLKPDRVVSREVPGSIDVLVGICHPYQFSKSWPISDQCTSFFIPKLKNLRRIFRAGGSHIYRSESRQICFYFNTAR